MVLAGGNGNGKTRCAKAVARWVMLVGKFKQVVPRDNYVKSMDVIYWHWPELLDTLKSGGWDVIDDCMDTCVLILDELGGGHDPSKVGVDKLCQILSRRENRWTLVTTNVATGAWENVFDRRVASRFMRNSTVVDMSGIPDYGAVL